MIERSREEVKVAAFYETPLYLYVYARALKSMREQGWELNKSDFNLSTNGDLGDDTWIACGSMDLAIPLPTPDKAFDLEVEGLKKQKTKAEAVAVQYGERIKEMLAITHQPEET